MIGVSRDHMFSIKDGYRMHISPEILAHPANCQLLLHGDNMRKHVHSSITLDELLERIRMWDLVQGA
jgi:hypothetical protein